jgi:cell division protein FtsA
MKIYSPNLFIEINYSEYIFIVGDENENNEFKLIYKHTVPIQGIENYRIIDFDLVFNILKKNIYLIEQKLNFTFKMTTLIIDNFNCSFINFTGFKKLNGSQILKENIIYILNSLKSKIDESEKKKTILHIFNSKYYLDKKKIENLPIGLFGDFYSHELSFILINNNDYKNLNNIFDKCNLRVNKILLKSFVEGSYISNTKSNHNTFFQITINKKNAQIFYFENDALKFEQNFNFGSDLILNDISKITSLKNDVIEKILFNSDLIQITSDEECIEKIYFENNNYRKIKKKLIIDIAAARIKELSEIFIINNINFTVNKKKNNKIFLKINDKSNFQSFKDSYSLFFSNDNHFVVNFLDDIEITDYINNAKKLVQFGWKKEAVPVIHPKKTLIAKFFNTLFE